MALPKDTRDTPHTERTIARVTLTTPFLTKEVDLAAGPITLMHGVNGSGKTILLRSMWETGQALEGGLTTCLPELDLPTIDHLEILFTDGSSVIHKRSSEFASLDLREPDCSEPTQLLVEHAQADAALQLLNHTGAGSRHSGIRGRRPSRETDEAIHPYAQPDDFAAALAEIGAISPDQREKAKEFSRDCAISFIPIDRVPPAYAASRLGNRAPISSLSQLLEHFASLMDDVVARQSRAALRRQPASPMDIVLRYGKANAPAVDDQVPLINEIKDEIKRHNELVDRYSKYQLIPRLHSDPFRRIADSDLTGLNLSFLPPLRDTLKIDNERLALNEDVFTRLELFEQFVSAGLDESRFHLRIATSGARQFRGYELRNIRGFVVEHLPNSADSNTEIIDPGEVDDEDEHQRPRGASKSRDLSFENLPSGVQQRLALAYMLLFDAMPGDYVLIDEPEISFDMRWQHRLVDDLREMAELRNLRLVVATHSPLLLDGNADITYPPFGSQQDGSA